MGGVGRGCGAGGKRTVWVEMRGTWYESAK